MLGRHGKIGCRIDNGGLRLRCGGGTGRTWSREADTWPSFAAGHLMLLSRRVPGMLADRKKEGVTCPEIVWSKF